jgi:4-cresol dehydrogenase (hydroxylating)
MMDALVKHTETAFDAAIAAWRRAIGHEHVVTQTTPYNRDTSPFAGIIPAALRPGTVAQVQDILRIARQYNVALYPVSTGHNWGYGTAVPVRSPAALLDLGRLNRIVAFDRDTGIVTLEPGVTQEHLYTYLQAHGHPFMVPVTGAGPSCSLIGNALERGFGVTPFTDHFGAIVSLRAVLPDGTLYRSRAHAAGPNLDGLFAQSNVGIVVEAGIALARKPQRCGALLFTLRHHDDAASVIGPLRDLLHDSGSTIGAINLMSRARVALMLQGQRRVAGLCADDTALPPGAWFGFATLYGTAAHMRATWRLSRRALRKDARGIRIVTRARLRWLGAVAAVVRHPALNDTVARLAAALDVAEGIPTSFALPLAYAVSGQPMPNAPLDPARDGCGLHWYAPIVPLHREAVAQFLAVTEATCRRHGLPAPVTLTLLSPRHAAATVPLLFDRADADAAQRAFECCAMLHDEGRALGFEPYRLGAPFMQTHDAAPLAQAIKSAIDPQGILAPGRYGLG